MFYTLASFSAGALFLSIFAYLQDFYTSNVMKEVENNLFLSFALSQLVGALVKLVLSDWV